MPIPPVLPSCDEATGHRYFLQGDAAEVPGELWPRPFTPRPGGRLGWVLLNPSTADAHTDDRTTSQIRWFTATAGYDRWWLVNLLTVRATEPRDLLDLRVEDVTGPPAEDRWWWYLAHVRDYCDHVVLAWGSRGAWGGRHPVGAVLQRRLAAVERELDPARLLCLGRTAASRQPAHPCRLGHATPLVPFSWSDLGRAGAR